jgi:diadenosine tetraphosphate (Ap4A) HIT family hydrolase
MATIFSRIIAGELPGHFVWRDERAVAFLSINPTEVGHTLVVPVAEVDRWTDLDAGTNAHLMVVAHTIGRAQQTLWSPERVGLMIAGFEVPHLHLHVIPLAGMVSLDLGRSAHSVDPADLAAAATLLRDELRAMGEASASDH